MFGRAYRPECCRISIMASILDQFEEQKCSIPSFQGAVAELEENEPPQFSRRRIDFYPSDNILHLCVCSDTILIAMANNILHRINTRQPDKPDEIDLSKYSSQMKVTGLFLSPNGQHALVSLSPKVTEPQHELLYLSRNSIKVKPLSKFRGVEVTSVAWNSWHQSGNNSGPVLIGTSRGLLIETDVGGDNEGIFNTNAAEYKQVFDIGKGTNCPVKGLQLYRWNERYHVLVTTASKIYHFHAMVPGTDDKSILQQIFRKYLSEPEKCESITSISKVSKLDVFISPSRNEPPTFAWMTSLGLYYGQIPEQDGALLENMEPIPYPDDIPKDFLLTSFHSLFVYNDHVCAISLLSKQVVFQDYFQDIETHGRPKHIIREPTRGLVYVFTDRSVFSYRVRKEDRDVWRDYMEMGDFEKARDYCHDKQSHLDQVRTRQAEALFNEGDYELSAYHYAQSSSISFEEVALKFLHADQVPHLMSFLRFRLEGLQDEDSMQRTMLVVWLVELYLSLLGKLPDGSERKLSLQSDLDELLSMPAVRECVRKNKGTIYDLMAAHGDTSNFIKLSLAHLDYERVIRQHIFKGQYVEALQVLKRALPSRKDLVYTFSPSLILEIPTHLVRLLIESAPHLKPAKLLPALAIAYDKPSAAIEVAQYLQHCMDKLRCCDQSVHNLLLAIYVKHLPERLPVYLAKEGQDSAAVRYDVHFALRLCQEKGLTEACVKLSALLGLWTSAVELALTVNVDLAEQTANMHRSDPDLLKTLWLKIAEHVVKEKHDIKAAMQFLKKCPLLKIEDILPFFPDFVTIDDFKSAICTALQEYKENIETLKSEMTESSQLAESITRDMSEYKNRHMLLTWSDTCCSCQLQLIMRAFYAFPCSHHFHMDCLQDAVSSNLNAAIRERLRELQRELASLSGDDISQASSGTTARELVQSSIDNILAEECPLCGNSMVESIDKPFVLEQDFDRVLKEWE